MPGRRSVVTAATVVAAGLAAQPRACVVGLLLGLGVWITGARHLALLTAVGLTVAAAAGARLDVLPGALP